MSETKLLKDAFYFTTRAYIVLSEDENLDLKYVMFNVKPSCKESSVALETAIKVIETHVDSNYQSEEIAGMLSRSGVEFEIVENKYAMTKWEATINRVLSCGVTYSDTDELMGYWHQLNALIGNRCLLREFPAKYEEFKRLQYEISSVGGGDTEDERVTRYIDAYRHLHQIKQYINNEEKYLRLRELREKEDLARELMELGGYKIVRRK